MTALTAPTAHRDDLGPVAYAAYSRGCRCSGCRAEKARYVADRRARGVEIDRRPNHGLHQPAAPVDHAAVIAHLNALHRLGWTATAIAQAAQTSSTTPSRILTRGIAQRSVAARILAVPLTRHIRAGRELHTCPCGVEFETRRSAPRIHHDDACARRARAGQPQQPRQQWTDTQLVAWMNLAAVDGTLTASRYAQFRVTHPDAPHARTLINRYHGWANAVHAARLHPGVPTRVYDQRLTDADLIAAVRAALRDGVHTALDYQHWARRHPASRPSLALIRARLDRWSTAVTLATERTAS